MPPSPTADRGRGDDDVPTARRILDATAEVLSRHGIRKLSLSAVAAQAGVSRPTLYRWFDSKDKLVEAFSLYELEKFEIGMASAIAGLGGADRLDAALRFIVEFQRSYAGARMIDVEPAAVIERMSRVMPVIRARLERLLDGPDKAIVAATATRVALSHYAIPSDDTDQFLAQLRYAVGMSRTRKTVDMRKTARRERNGRAR